jgi:hypothetical protein
MLASNWRWPVKPDAAAMLVKTARRRHWTGLLTWAKQRGIGCRHGLGSIYRLWLSGLDPFNLLE